MKLLVVTPTLGDSPWLDETIASVAASAGDCVHALVAPPAKVAALQAKYPRLRVISDNGTGMYGAINAGLAAVDGWDAFTYLNDDDLLLPTFRAVLAAVADAGAGAGERGGAVPRVAYGGVRLIDAHGRRLGGIPISSAPALNRQLYALRLEPVYQHGTVATRAVYERIGGFDATFRTCGDSEFYARACVAGVPFVCATRREVAAFRLRPGQLTKARDVMVAERKRVDEKLGLLTSPANGARFAGWRFRAANAAIYLERIARHGFISFDTLLTRGGE